MAPSMKQFKRAFPNTFRLSAKPLRRWLSGLIATLGEDAGTAQWKVRKVLQKSAEAFRRLLEDLGGDRMEAI